MERSDIPDSTWKDALHITNIMLKLRENQPKKERDELINCKTGKPVPNR